MRNVLFIMTHLGSGSDQIISSLQAHPDIEIFETGNAYNHPDVVGHLVSLPHKRNNAKSIYSDVIYENGNFTCRAMTGWYKFTYIIRNPADALPSLIDRYHDPQRAALHYCYRLRGLAEYSLRTPNAPLFSWDGDPEAYSAALTDHLGCRPAISMDRVMQAQTCDLDVPHDILAQCEDAFSRYSTIMKNRSA